jgi:hypothetical protein
MIRCSNYKSVETGWTLLDLLVCMVGVLPGLWVSSFFHGVWLAVVLPVLSLVFGVGFWCFLFLWLPPLIERHRKARHNPDDDSRRSDS